MEVLNIRGQASDGNQVQSSSIELNQTGDNSMHSINMNSFICLLL